MATRRTKPPKFSGTNQDPFLTGEDAIALGLKYTVPVAELISSAGNIKRKRKRLPTKFTKVNLDTLPVKDLPEQSFALPFRPPSGSSLAERVGGQKFSDAFQTAQEENFNTQNVLQKRQQEQQNLGIENQEEMINAQIANQEEGLNTRLKFQDFAHDLGRRDQAISAINYGLATDPNQVIQSQDIRATDRMNTILTNPDQFTQEEIDEAKRRFFGRFGGKKRTKFSY